ncbi:DUF2963 domain-containing protein [Candidatus Phytoplasma meliae]|uniref:DUF2963 domain-containing protein n=1 Tax=Candidatus Phytoplasma meliae TaxID=1848402 RepID=UPI003B96964F
MYYIYEYNPFVSPSKHYYKSTCYNNNGTIDEITEYDLNTGKKIQEISYQDKGHPLHH